MTNIEYRCFLDLMMCSDPWPVPDTGDPVDGHAVLQEFADSEARKRGYDSWVVAFHEHKP